jgi:hypothetical protein
MRYFSLLLLLCAGCLPATAFVNPCFMGPGISYKTQKDYQQYSEESDLGGKPGIARCWGHDPKVTQKRIGDDYWVSYFATIKNTNAVATEYTYEVRLYLRGEMHHHIARYQNDSDEILATPTFVLQPGEVKEIKGEKCYPGAKWVELRSIAINPLTWQAVEQPRCHKITASASNAATVSTGEK